MQKTKIEWVKNLDGSEGYVWNPLVGCKHACYYCYAERLNKRFHFIKKWNKPEYFPKKLSDPYKLRKPSKIFVSSMADLFGEWVPSKFIKKVIGVAKANPQHIFMFLTKNRRRYLDFDFPNNCWLGFTITGEGAVMTGRWVSRMKQIKESKPDNKFFLSAEPLLGSFRGNDLSYFDLVIVGAMTGPKSVVPEKDWIESIEHKNIFWKENIKKYLELYGIKKHLQ